MLTQTDFEQRIVATLDDPEIAERYQAGDPLVIQQIRSHAAFLALLSQEIDVATLEPFLKTRDRSILADATNKGILPTGTPCQHQIDVINQGSNSVTLSQGRMIDDNQGRPWRLLAAVNVASGETATVVCEQSEVRQISYTVPFAEEFHRVTIGVQDGLFLAGIVVQDDATIPNLYIRKPRWMNVAPGEYAINVTTNDRRQIMVEFGSDARAGRTVSANQVMNITLIETYGEVEASKLKEAALQTTLNNDENKIKIRFSTAGLIRAGANPLSVAELRLLASYPALYDENSVFLGNFDFLVRQKFMARAHYLAVWNENIQERMYGVSLGEMNHLQLAVVAKNPLEQVTLEDEIAQVIGRADSLYEGRVKKRVVQEREYALTITGRLAAVHDMDTVKAQIRSLLTAQYGRTRISTSRWLSNGFNRQEVATLIRQSITAFQDRMSDFSVEGEDLSVSPVRPHEWLYLTDSSISINLTRTAETGDALWAL